MYEGHFHLERRPFAATPDPGCCYLSPTQTPLFQTVSRCIESGQGISILTGPAGIGKTLLVQVLLAESAQRFTTVYLGTGQFPTRRALLQAILYELGQPYGGMTDQELRLELNTALRNLIAQRDGLLLILDEAHLLSDRLLEEVRLLADLAQHGVPLVRVVLSGNPEFEERLTAPALAAFNQRVACHVALETLTQQESISYLEYRIQWAGGSIEPLFERDALKLIAYASDGVPRCLNQLADHSLLQAYLAGASTVTAAIVRQALADVQQLPLRWNPSALHDRSVRSTAIVPSSVEVEETSPSVAASSASADDAFEVRGTARVP
jgi:general secretion pathway protein A